MATLIYDLETDNLLDKVTRVHCLVTRDFNTGVVRSYFRAGEIKAVPDGTIEEGIAAILEAEVRVGHNIQGYDELVLQKLYPHLVPKRLEFDRIRDTLIGARVGWPEEHLKTVDYARMNMRDNTLPKNMIGRHSLEAWGHRLKCFKGDYGKVNGFEVFTDEMLLYCIQDTEVTRKLAQRLNRSVDGSRVVPRTAWTLEQKFAWRMERQTQHGFPFNVERAELLAKTFMEERARISEDLTKLTSPFEDHYVTPKKKIAKVKLVPFNPGSRVHIARLLQERYNWKPTEFTPEGRPKIDETVLDGLSFPEVALLKAYLLLEKRIGAVAEGKSAWLSHVKEDGRIHGKVSHNGAVTGRCTHSAPNVTQVPRVGSPYGKECRACFGPAGKLPGWKLVGGDASGLELRMLAHYMAEYDGGAYARIVTTGSSKNGTDVHTVNMRAAGLTSRDDAKTFIYAFLYGAGDEKLGKIIGLGKVAGRKLRMKFLGGLPALKKLIEDTQKEAAIKRMLVCLDGRKLHVRSAHAALNTKLQGAGAIVMKLACVLYHERLEELGLVEGVDFMQVHAAHDEFQALAKEQHAETVGKTITWAIEQAGLQLGVRCPLAGEYKVGDDWSETH